MKASSSRTSARRSTRWVRSGLVGVALSGVAFAALAATESGSLAFFGVGAGANNTGGFNAFFGGNAGNANTSGGQNTFIGHSAGFSNTTGIDNTYLGNSTGFNGSGSENTFVGRNAGFNNTASGNSFFGRAAGAANTSGTNSAFFGREAGTLNTTGSDNTYVGVNAGRRNTTSSDNTIMGSEAGRSSSGEANVFIGGRAGRGDAADGDLSTGSSNSFVGHDSGRSNTTGSFNSFLGEDSGLVNTTGEFNTFIGENAGLDNTTGSNNTFLGARAGQGAIALTNAAAIGHRATVGQDNAMVLGSIPGVNAGTDYVNVGMGTTTPVAPLHILREDASANLLQLESNAPGGAQDRAMMFLSNNGGTRFEFANTATGNNWRFQAGTGNNDNFEITKVGSGGLELVLGPTGNLTTRGSMNATGFNVVSDRNAKQDISDLDAQEVLARVEALPIQQWRYKSQPDALHVGPMAQDFHAAFGLGSDDRHVSPADLAGVALAAIKAQQAEIARLRNEVADKDQRLASLESRLASVELIAQALSPRVAMASE